MQNQLGSRVGVGTVFAMIVASVAVPPAATAAVIESDANSGTEANFDSGIVATDLVNQGRPSFVSVTATGSPAFAVTGSNDATTAHNTGLTFWGASHPAGE